MGLGSSVAVGAAHREGHVCSSLESGEEAESHVCRPGVTCMGLGSSVAVGAGFGTVDASVALDGLPLRVEAGAQRRRCKVKSQEWKWEWE